MEDKIPVVYCITLYKVLDKILYVDGSEKVDNPVERELPFNVKYKLQRNLDILLKDYIFYQSKRSELINKYGTKNEEGTATIVNDPDSIEKFKQELLEAINTLVEHTFKKFTPDEVNSITSNINITTNEMQIFIAYLVDDPELVNDIKKGIESLSETGEVKEETSEVSGK